MDEHSEIERAATSIRWKLWVALCVTAAFGILLNLIATFYSPLWLEPILRELGAALIVAAAIGATVDRFLKQEFARDAFLAAFRYVLPKEFRAEMERVLRYAFISDQQVWRVIIERTENSDVVKVTTSFERTIENKTSSPQTKCGLYTIPEFNFLNGKSQIVECGIDDGSRKITNFKLKDHGRYLEATTDEIKIAAGAKAQLWGKAIQYRRSSDVVYEVFGTPASTPEIEVIAPDDMNYHAEFGAAGEIDVERFSQRQKLHGVYFPGQVMLVQWWPKGP